MKEALFFWRISYKINYSMELDSNSHKYVGNARKNTNWTVYNLTL